MRLSVSVSSLLTLHALAGTAWAIMPSDASGPAAGVLEVAAGMSSQRGRVFLATELTEGEHDREHEEQDMHSEWFSRAQLEQMIRDGVITDAQSIAAWAMLLLAGR